MQKSRGHSRSIYSKYNNYQKSFSLLSNPEETIIDTTNKEPILKLKRSEINFLSRNENSAIKKRSFLVQNEVRPNKEL